MSKTLKTITSIALVLVMLFMFAACSTSDNDSSTNKDNSSNNSSSDNKDNSSSDATYSADKPLTFRLATIQGDDTPVGMGALKFGEIANEAFEGRVKFEIFNNSTLGTETEIRDALEIGSIDMALLGQSIMTGKVDEANIMICYYTTADPVVADWFYQESDLGQELYDKYEEITGVKALATNMQSAMRYFMAKKPFTNPSEFNMKIRVPAGSPIYEELVSAMGAMPVSLSLAECYTSLDSGIIEGLELPCSLHVSNSYYDLCGYIMNTQHMAGRNFIWMCGASFDKLTPEDQELIVKCAEEAGLFERSQEESLADGYMQTLLDNGVEYVEVDVDAFIEAVQPVYEAKRAAWGDKWFDEIYAFMDSQK